MDNFITIYSEELYKAVKEHPEYYAFGLEGVPVCLERMIRALKGKTYNKDGFAFKATCKRLGIKHTYQAINAYITESKSKG